MGVRSNISYEIQVGAENSLDSLLFQRAIEETVDTMDKESSFSDVLAASETLVVDKGGITTIRFIYVEGDGDINVFLGGAAATTAVVTAIGAGYPTGFAGGETLDLEIDSVAFRTTFLVADQALTDVINRINAAAAFAGLSGLVASDFGGQLRLTSTTTGTASIVEIVAQDTGGTPASGSIIAIPKASLVDGETFTLDDGVNPVVTFEFDDDASVAAGNIAVDISTDTSAIEVADRMVRVINQQTNLDLTAFNAGGTVALVTIINDTDGTQGNVTTWAKSVGDGGFVVTQPLGGTSLNLLGVTVGTATGLDPTPNQSPMKLRQMGDTSNPSAVESLKSFLLVTAETTVVTLVNPSTTDAVRFRVLLLGDLVDPVLDC